MNSGPDISPGDYVLDAHALFAFLQNEEGEGLVADWLECTAVDVTLHVSLINSGEIAYTAERELETGQAGQILDDVRRLPMVLCGIDEQRILAAAHVKAPHALSYADAFAVALAQKLGATLVSGDPDSGTAANCPGALDQVMR